MIEKSREYAERALNFLAETDKEIVTLESE